MSVFEFSSVSKPRAQKSNTGVLFACTFPKIKPSESIRGRVCSSTANIYTTTLALQEPVPKANYHFLSVYKNTSYLSFSWIQSVCVASEMCHVCRSGVFRLVLVLVRTVRQVRPNLRGLRSLRHRTWTEIVRFVGLLWLKLNKLRSVLPKFSPGDRFFAFRPTISKRGTIWSDENFWRPT